MKTKYYHAGVEYTDGDAKWSDHTRRTYAAAEREARKMAKGKQGRPIVEYWSRKYGLRPGDANLVEGADYVD